MLFRSADLYQKIYPDTKMICGDIKDDSVFKNIIKMSGKIDLLIATPPCQGLSIAGKNRKLREIINDERNYLVMKAIDFIKIKKPKYALIENVPSLLKLQIHNDGELIGIIDFIKKTFEKEYNIETKIVDSSDFGVPQVRKRAIIKIYKKGLNWPWPKKASKKSVKKAIGYLPSLNPGEKSNIPFHYARKHIARHILWMKNTPTGKSAFDNKKYFPQKEDGAKIKGYNSSYRRINWNSPAPTITMRNDAISSQRNVHPGRKNKNGTYSDPRVLTPLEIMLLFSLPHKWNIPKDTPETLLRKCIGEGVPPLMIKKIIDPIFKK